MTDSPRCANCFQEIPWTPVFNDGDIFCCDGCVIGGPCVCTYDGPPIRLDTKDILQAAGYDLEALAAELSVCANCFEEFTREPVYAKETTYCCQGCVRGGPCACTYGEATEGLSSFEHEVNRLWHHMSQWEDAAPDDEKQREDQRVNDLWLLRQDDSALPGPAEDEAAKVERPLYLPRKSSEPDPDAELDLDSALQPVVQRKAYSVVASPLDEVADVRAFTSALASTPSVDSVILTHYSGDAATFEIEARDLHKVVRELLEGDYYPIRSFSMSPEGLELILRSTGGDLLATAVQPDGPTLAEESNAVRWERSAVSAADADVRPFRFEMGVDVFFNGRHQVEVGGIMEPVHMHSWRIQATLVGESVADMGSLVVTQQVKEVITAFVGRFNEKMLNKVSPFDEIMPTSNNIARVIFDHVSWEIQGERGGEASPGRGSGGAPGLKSIKLWESPTSYVEYSGDARAA